MDEYQVRRLREEGQLLEGTSEADCCRGRVGIHCGKSDSLEDIVFLVNYILDYYVALRNCQS